jgi:hypothetical protein
MQVFFGRIKDEFLPNKVQGRTPLVTILCELETRLLIFREEMSFSFAPERPNGELNHHAPVWMR